MGFTLKGSAIDTSFRHVLWYIEPHDLGTDLKVQVWEGTGLRSDARPRAIARASSKALRDRPAARAGGGS